MNKARKGTKPICSCFPGFLGYPRKSLPEDMTPHSSPIKTRWSKSLLRKLRKSDIKTVPVEEADHHSEPIQAGKKKKIKNIISQVTPQQKMSDVQDIIPQVEENTIHPSTPKKQPPINRTVFAPSPPITSSPKLKKQLTDIGQSSKTRQERHVSGKIDPVVGMSIIAVTLIIMVVWGMVCAIVCTCGWCYLIPLLKATTATSTSSTSNSSRGAKVILPNSRVESDPNLNLEAYKKRVVLEGFLQRTYNSP